jgi:glycosyltransferase involved in cell wall biosynthesis
LFEGLPYTLLQAMSVGARVVATRCAGLVEVLEDRQDALLVPLRSSDEIAGAVLEILDDPDLGRRLGENARAKIARAFSLETTIDRTRELYLESVSG